MNGKNPTKRQKQTIRERCGLDPAQWLIQKNTPTLLQLVHRHTGRVRKIEWNNL